MLRDEFIYTLQEMGRDYGVYGNLDYQDYIYHGFNDNGDYVQSEYVAAPYFQLERFSYAGMYYDIADKSNYITLKSDLPRLSWLSFDRGDCRVIVNNLPTRSKYFDELIDILRQLAHNDPLLDDENYYQLKDEEIQGAWIDFGRNDLARAMRKHMAQIDPENAYGWNMVEFSDESIDHLRELFETYFGEYAEVEQGPLVYFPYDSNLDKLSAARIGEWLDKFPVELEPEPPPFDAMPLFATYIDGPTVKINVASSDPAVNLIVDAYIVGNIALHGETSGSDNLIMTHIPSGLCYCMRPASDDMAHRMFNVALYVANNFELAALSSLPVDELRKVGQPLWDFIRHAIDQ